MGITLSSIQGQEETFRRYYGTPYPFATENAFTTVPSGNRMALVGTRENRESAGLDLAVWFFDPLSGVALDSTVISAPGNIAIEEVYPGPDGGFLVAHPLETSTADLGMTFSYISPAGALVWEQFIDANELNFGFEGIRDLTFVSATEVYFSVRSSGSGDDLISRIVNLNATEGITNTIFFGDAGATDIWSVEYQPNGDLLIAGQAQFDVFVALLDSNGEVRWNTQFDRAEGSPNTYEYLSDAHRPAGEDYILATGKIFGGRAVLIMDTLGNRLEETTLEDLFLITEKEQVDWLGRGDTLFANSNERSFSVLSVTFDDGTSFAQEVQGNAGGYRVRGSYYDQPNNQIVTALNNSGDVAIVRSPVEGLDVDITDVGTTFSGFFSEVATGIASSSNGGFILQTADLPTSGSTDVNLVQTDGLGEVIATVNVGTVSAPRITIRNNFRRADDGNYLVLSQSIVGPEVKKFATTGTELWSVRFQNDFNVQSRVVTPLSAGRFALSDFSVEQLPDFSIVPVVTTRLGDSTGTISDTLRTVELANPNGGYAGHDNNLMITGANATVDSARIINYNTMTGEVVWQYSSGAASLPQAFFTDLLLLQGGNYGVIFNARTRDNANPMNLLEYVRLGADGTELSRYDIPELTKFIYSPRSSVKEDTVTLVFGASSADEENNPTDHGIRVHRFISATGEVVLDKVFPAYFGVAEPAGITSLPDGRTAMLVTTPASDTSASDDIMLLVFDADGNITNLRSSASLSAEVNLSPNPTPGLLHVQAEGAGTQALNLYLFDASGRMLQQRTFVGTGNRQTTVDLGQYPAGTYFLMLRDGQGKTLTRRVVKQ